MSLSNSNTESFKPLSINNLESFDEELTTATDESEPDYDRFKLLIDKPGFEKEDVSEFEALYKKVEEKEEIIFKPMVDPKIPEGEVAAVTGEQSVPETADPETIVQADPEPEMTQEEAGFEKGYEQGFKAGEEKGFAQGFEKGQQEGEAKGIEQGREQGIEQGRQQGLEQGMEEGRNQGMEEAKQSAGEIISSLQDALGKADRVLEDLVDVYEDRLISLVRQIAEKTVMAKVEMDDEAVRPLVVDALKHLVEPEEVILSVSADDYEYIEMVKDQFFEEIESLTRISVRSDPGVSRGGCRIETRTASVSTDIESRLQAIFEAMIDSGA